MEGVSMNKVRMNGGGITLCIPVDVHFKANLSQLLNVNLKSL